MNEALGSRLGRERKCDFLLLLPTSVVDLMKFTFGGGKSAKTQPIKTKRPAVLLDDGNSSSDGEGAAAASARPKPTAMSFAQQTNEAAVIGQAIQEDPSIFDYDASHDTTQARRNVLADRKRGAIDPGTGKLQSRYVDSIKTSSERRKLELGIYLSLPLILTSIRKSKYPEIETSEGRGSLGR